jgi:hypothetical protein
MTLQQRQSHLIQQISQVKDERVLILLEEELSYHLNNKQGIELSQLDIDDLIKMADEPDDKDIVSETDYRKATDRWRTK